MLYKIRIDFMLYKQQQNNSSYNNPGKDGYHDQDRLASSDRSRITMLIDNQLRH